ncbi:MAG: FAD:protein FMN transferase, partial [Clostridia bacterium]|nr:FAD:protein FMN transferase [Clostridia bacterium]
MKKFFCLILTLIFILSFPFLFACSGEKSFYTFDYFNTETTIKAKGVRRDSDFDGYVAFCKDVLAETENALSLSVENSELNMINALAVNEKTEISAVTYAVISESKKANALTEKFNPAVLPLVDLWQLSPSTYPASTFTLPTQEQIDGEKEKTDFSALKISEEDGKYYVEKNLPVKIDLGGIAKGYALKIMADEFVKRGFSGGYSVGVRNPRSVDVGETFLSLKATGVTYVTTSGDYERFYVKDGKRYSHIIDVTTGAPIDTGVISATVIGDPVT